MDFILNTLSTYFNLFFLISIHFIHLQNLNGQNLVNNPNFVNLDTCPYGFGQVRFASGWITENEQTPDLFDSCAQNPSYVVPIEFSCATIAPRQDDGFVGLVSYGQLESGNNIREVISTHLIDTLTKGIDYYCSISVSPNPRCIINPDLPNYLCYTSGIGMAIVYSNTAFEIVVEADQIIDDIGNWTVLNGCYKPQGQESRVRIQTFKDDQLLATDCYTEDGSINFAYTFVDNVVVAPFDILPDTLIVCDIEEVYFEGINFYDLPLSWDDEVVGGPRNFIESDTYTLRAKAGDCHLEESLVVEIVDEELFDLEPEINKCEGEPLRLSLNIPGHILWPDGSDGNEYIIGREGQYDVTVTTTCNTLDFTYSVSEVDCNEVFYSGNIFSPNDDGVNDELRFYLNEDLTLSGTIMIFDRWGNMVFESTDLYNAVWNGKNRSNEGLTPGVYPWIFISEDNTIIQSGEITLIR